MKKLVTLILILFSGSTLLGQDTVIYSFYGTTGEDVFAKAFVDGDSLILFGSTDNGANQSDIYVIKTDRNQSGFRARKIGSDAIEYLVDIDFDSIASRYYALINYYSGFSATEYDFAVVVLDSNFNEIDRKIFEINGFQEGVVIRKVQSEILVGYHDEESTKILALDGALSFQFEFISTQNIVKDIRQLGDRIYVLSDSSTSSNQVDICLSRYDLNYSLQNVLLIGDSLDELGSSLAEFNSGVLIAGSSSSLNLPGDFDAIICFIDTNDTLVWMRDHGFASGGPFNDDFGIGALNVNDTAILFMIQTNTYGLGKTDYMYYQLSQNGNYLSSNSFGTDETELLDQLFYFSQDEIFLLGTSDYQEIGATDYLVVKTKYQIPNEVKIVVVLQDSSEAEVLGLKSFSDELGFNIYAQNGQLHIASDTKLEEVSLFNYNGQQIAFLSALDVKNVSMPIENLMNMNLLIVVNTNSAKEVFRLRIVE